MDEDQNDLQEKDFSLESDKTLKSQISIESIGSENEHYTSADRNVLMF